MSVRLLTIQVVALALTLPMAALADRNCKNVRLFHTVDHEQAWQDVSYLASEELEGRRAGKRGAKLAREYIAARFDASNLESLEDKNTGSHLPDGIKRTELSKYYLPFELKGLFSSKWGFNVAGLIQGTRVPEKYIVITAHYDHLGKKRGKIYPGADDNASGVSALLAIAAHFAVNKPSHSMILLATDYEESGLYGAKAFVENPPVPLSSILLNINLDMIGNPGRKHVLYLGGTRRNPQLRDFAHKVLSQSGQCVEFGHDGKTKSRDRKYTIDWYSASDHYAFAKQGVPYMFLGVDDHKHYHQPTDNIDNLNRIFLLSSIETSIILARLADASL
ncbi:MAG: M28 family peptidase [Alteromonadaceae bacterium]|nr:M28 family peptidase [Alteromonadaceae bacterium]